MEQNPFSVLPKRIQHDNTALCSYETLGGTENKNSVHKITNIKPDTADPRPLNYAHQPCDSSYTVTCSVTVALAVPGEGFENRLVMAVEKEKRTFKKVHSRERIEAPTPKSYYHIEYNLLPDGEPVKVDLVMFGSVAKVYMSNETKMLIPWQEEEELWLSWSQSVKLNMNKEMLLKMQSHKIIFRVWDTKDKVCAKAKHDRPRKFRLPPQCRNQQDTQLTVCINNMVNNPRAVYEKEKPTCKTFIHDVAAVKKQNLETQISDHEHTAEMKEEIHKTGSASVELSAMPLLAGHQSLTGCLQMHSGSVFKGLCNITLDQPLMSTELKAELNPLVITILSASSLPSTPIPFAELEQKCMPVYCQYKFHKMPMHKTKGKRHGSYILFKDVNVIFTGLLSPAELSEFLSGPPVQIEVHDRDRKDAEPVTVAAVFGSDISDDKLASPVFNTIKQEKRKPHHPYGIAQMKLTHLLREHRTLNLTLPIRCSHPEQWLSSEMNEWGVHELERVDARRLEENCMPVGQYMKAGSELKVQVEIAHPLNPDPKENESQSPFSRIVYMFKHDHIAALKLKSEILRINSVAFNVDEQSEEMSQKILSSHKMTISERENKKLNVLTGFYMLDDTLHLFVLEGLKEKAIKHLWQTIPIKLDEVTHKKVVVLYNSALRFSERLYDLLDVGLSPIHLQEPLETILSNPLLYVRGVVPYSCLQALLRISQLCQVRTLEEVAQNNLFPSANMIYCLIQKFSRIYSKENQKFPPHSKDVNICVDHCVSQRMMDTYLDNFNKKYIEWKRFQANQGIHAKNFVQANIQDIYKASTALQKVKPKVFVAEVNDGQCPHNYSTQKLNSTILARKLMFKEMAKYPTRRFSYSQNYQTLTLDAVDTEAEQIVLKARSRAAWRTHDGFIYPGFKSSIESNQHPKKPDEARIEELRKPWKEKNIYRNTLQSILNRSMWPGNQPHKDFELYKKPPLVLGPTPPLSTGEALHQEQLEAANEQYNRWLRKLLPDVEFTGHSHIPEFKCHMKRAGLDKLHDLLKDKPVKLPLKKAWKKLSPIPMFVEEQHFNPNILQSRKQEKQTTAE